MGTVVDDAASVEFHAFFERHYAELSRLASVRQVPHPDVECGLSLRCHQAGTSQPSSHASRSARRTRMAPFGSRMHFGAFPSWRHW